MTVTSVYAVTPKPFMELTSPKIEANRNCEAFGIQPARALREIRDTDPEGAALAERIGAGPDEEAGSTEAA